MDKTGTAKSPRNVPAARMDNDGQIWTRLILLRIRRLGVRVPPSAPPKPQVTDLLSAISEALDLCLGGCCLTISHKRYAILWILASAAWPRCRSSSLAWT